MAWIYLADTEGSPLPLASGLDPSPTANKIAIVNPSSYHAWLTDYCPKHLYGTIYPLYAVENFHGNLWISPTEDSPARTSVVQAMELAWKESEADYSSKCVAWSKKSSPLSFSWKTCQPLELKVFEQSSFDLQNWGMTVGGLVYLPQKLEPTTSGRGGSYWATPKTVMTDEDYETYLARMRRSKDPKTNTKTKISSLAQQVRMPQFWPTPCADDTGSRSKKYSQGGTALSMAAGGKLNPTWVEWLMGLPLGWTELKPWAMEWFRSKSKQRSKDL